MNRYDCRPKRPSCASRPRPSCSAAAGDYRVCRRPAVWAETAGTAVVGAREERRQ